MPFRTLTKRTQFAQNKPRTQRDAGLSGLVLLEHFNIFYSHLGRREDKAGKEDCTAILKYCEQI